MRKFFKSFICAVIAVTMSFSFVGCSVLSSGNSGDGGSGDSGTSSTESDSATYTIQYTDDNGIHKIEVKSGELYSLASIPERTGYTFLGLYDAEVGGTQYVNSSGISVSAFTDKQNLVLYPQYQAKEYTVVLDYGEAAVTASRQYSVAYGESLPALPTDLTVEHKIFSGWYTEEDCGGTRVSDKYGLIPVVSVVDEDNFEITGSTKYIYLYAGFTTQTYTVTLNYDSWISSETVEVEYGANVSDIVTSTRNSDGYAVLSWSLSSGGSEYTGTITDDITLYALEWAPCIIFNSNGGDSVNTIVARAGETIALPAATRQSYKFMYWAYSDGNEAELYAMPSSSITLKAVWQSTIAFDSNGGTDVDDISEAAGTAITLPTPEKDGYIFAGWYTSDKTQYTSTKMPVSSIELKAGWYEKLADTVIVIASNSYSNGYKHTSPSTSDWCYTFNFNNYFSNSNYYQVIIDWHVSIKTAASSTQTAYANFYSQKTISSSYLLQTQTFNNVTDSYREYTFTTSFMVNDSFYICFYNSYSGGHTYLSDFYYTVTYPDTATLYL